MDPATKHGVRFVALSSIGAVVLMGFGIQACLTAATNLFAAVSYLNQAVLSIAPRYQLHLLNAGLGRVAAS